MAKNASGDGEEEGEVLRGWRKFTADRVCLILSFYAKAEEKIAKTKPSPLKLNWREKPSR